MDPDVAKFVVLLRTRQIIAGADRLGYCNDRNRGITIACIALSITLGLDEIFPRDYTGIATCCAYMLEARFLIGRTSLETSDVGITGDIAGQGCNTVGCQLRPR